MDKSKAWDDLKQDLEVEKLRAIAEQDARGALTLAHGTYTPVQLAAAVQASLAGSTALGTAGVNANVTVNNSGRLLGNILLGSGNGNTLNVGNIGGGFA